MAQTKDWRVRYGHFPPEVMGSSRSKPFDTEDEALAWATSWLRQEGPSVHAQAHVNHRTQTRPDLDVLDPVPPSHLLLWVDEDTLVKKTWPSQSRADQDAEVRRVMTGLGKEGGAKMTTVLSRVEDEPLRVLPGGRR